MIKLQTISENITKVLSNILRSAENYESALATFKAAGQINDNNPNEFAKEVNSEHGRLDTSVYDCPICHNKGFILFIDDKGQRSGHTCSCMSVRYSKALIKHSGLEDILEEKTFDKWDADTPKKQKVKTAALKYSDAPKGWFYLSGNSGTGKTHICTAICKTLLEKRYPTQYVIWREISGEAKRHIMDEEYGNIMEPLKTVKVLYIDDLFKTKRGEVITGADVNIALEIINARYYRKDLLTIISTELTLDSIIRIDEALGSRIFEKAKQNCLNLFGENNYRLK